VDYTATNGTTVVLTDALTVGQIVEIDNLLTAFLPTNALRTITTFTATAAQTTFSVTYTQGLIDVFYNGSNLAQSEYTATNGTSIILATACQVNDIVVVYAYSYAVGAYSGIGGSGTTNYIPKFTASSAIGNSAITDDGTTVTLVSRALSGTSATFSSGLGIATTPLAGNLSISTSAFSNAGTKSYTADNVGGISAYVSSQDPYRGYLDIYSTRSGDGNTLGGSIIRFLTSSVSASVNAIERMRIRDDGNTTIGFTDGYSNIRLNVRGVDTGSSNYTLHAETTSGSNFWVRNDGVSYLRGNVLIGTTTDSGNAKLHLATAGSCTQYFDATAYGGANALNIQLKMNPVNGNFYIQNASTGTGVYLSNGGTSWTGVSDERLKTDLVEISDATNKVSQLRALTGRFKTDEEWMSRSFLIAQDVEKVFPEAVNYDEENDIYGIQYTDMIPLLVKAIQEQNQLITDLRTEVEQLKQK
jgi:hypothetical protein